MSEHVCESALVMGEAARTVSPSCFAPVPADIPGYGWALPGIGPVDNDRRLILISFCPYCGTRLPEPVQEATSG